MRRTSPINTRIYFYQDKRFYLSMSLAILVTIIGLAISALTADFGFKTYWGAMIFFPYEMLSTLHYGVIPVWIGAISFFQYIPYGLIIWYCWRRQKWQPFVVLLAIHLLATGLAFGLIKYGAEKNDFILVEQAK